MNGVQSQSAISRVGEKSHKIKHLFTMEKKPLTASEIGKIGGSKKSAAKTKACRENAKKPRKKPNKTRAATIDKSANLKIVENN